MQQRQIAQASASSGNMAARNDIFRKVGILLIQWQGLWLGWIPSLDSHQPNFNYFIKLLKLVLLIDWFMGFTSAFNDFFQYYLWGLQKMKFDKLC